MLSIKSKKNTACKRSLFIYFLFIKRYFRFTQYYVLIQKLRSNVDNLDFIRPIEKEKYFNKEEPSIFPLLFLNNP